LPGQDVKYKGSDCSVTLKNKSIRAGLKGQPAVLEGELSSKVCGINDNASCSLSCFVPWQIDTEESTWTLVDGCVLTIVLWKTNNMEWWSRVITTDPEINTRKIQPENSKVGGRANAPAEQTACLCLAWHTSADT
jgi:hypothetical protein